MPIPTDTHWNIRRLNWVFAASSLAMLGTLAWSVLQDYDKDWRKYQRNGRALEAAMIEETVTRPLSPQDQRQLDELDRQLGAQQALARAREKDLDALRAEKLGLDSDIKVLENRHNDLKAETNVLTGDYERAFAAGDQAKAEELQRRLAEPTHVIARQVEDLAKLKADRDAKKKQIDALTESYDKLEKKRKQLLEDRDALAKKRATLEPQGLLAKLSAQVRATPLMQFINPADKVVQQDLADVRSDLGGFKQVNTIDRCMTCHVNAHRKEFTEDKVLGFLERQLASQREVKFPTPPKSAADPAAQPENPGAAAMPEFWHAWGTKLLSRRDYEVKPEGQRSLDGQLDLIVAAAGKYANPPVSAALVAKAQAAVDGGPQLPAELRQERDAAVPSLLRQLYGDFNTISAKALSGATARKEALAELDEAAKQAYLYPARVREMLKARLSPDAVRLVRDRYRRALVREVNRGRKQAGKALLDDSRALLAHPNLDLYVNVDSKHSFEAVGCTSCHDGSGQETNFVLAAHTPRQIWVDDKTGAPVLPVELTGLEPTHEEHEGPTLASMLRAIYPEHDPVPEHAASLYLSAELKDDKDGGAAPVDVSNVETAPSPEHAKRVAYVDAVTGAKGRAVPQGKYWADTYEAEAGRSFELVYHEWDWPMRPPEYLQANCVRCHNGVNDVREHAPVVYEGRTLFSNLGCVNCHQMDSIPAAERRQVGPDLRHVTEKLSPEFINTWVWAPKSFRPSTKMPHFFLLENNSSDEEIRRTRQEARAITEYLTRTSTPLPPKHVIPDGLKANADEGRKLFKSIGCRACHTNLNLPADDPENPSQELADVTVGQQWITNDLLKKGDLARKLEAKVAKETAERMEAELPSKVDVALRDDAKKRLTKAVEAEEGFKPKNPKKQTKEEKAKIAAEAAKRLELPEETDKLKAALPGKLAEAKAALPNDVAAAIPDEIARATGAEAKRLFDAMTYNQRQLYALENLEAPELIQNTPAGPGETARAPELPKYPDGTPKPLFVHHGPELSGVGTKLLDHRTPEQARAWLFDWLKEPRHYSSYTVMPNLRLSDQQALDLAEHLLTQKRDAVETKVVEGTGDAAKSTVVPDAWSAGLAAPDSAKLAELTAFFLRARYSPEIALDRAKKLPDLEALAAEALVGNVESSPAAGSIARGWVQQIEDGATSAGRNPADDLRLVYLGKKLVAHYGCMSCHQINGTESLTSPCANLSDWGQKDVGKLDYAYLDPHKVHERPPPFKVPLVNGLSAEASKLAHAPLPAGAAVGKALSLGWPEVEHRRESWLTQKLLNTRVWDRGRVLLEPQPQHAADGTLTEPGKPYDKLRMPTFYLNEQQAHAIVTFVISNRDRLITEKLLAKANNDRARQIAYGRHLTQKFNCVGCHQLDHNVPAVQQYFAKADLPTKAPPSLRGEGNKVVADWLSRFLWNVEPLRPLLQPSGGIRMPSFPFSDDGAEVNAIAAYFASLSNKESEELHKLIEPVRKHHDAVAQAAAIRAARAAQTRPASAQVDVATNAVADASASPTTRAGDTPGPTTGPASRPAGTPPVSGGFAVAAALVLPAQTPTTTSGPRPGPEAVVIPADDWFREPALAGSTEKLKQWAIETREMEPFQFDPFRNNKPGELEASYASLLYKASYLAGLYHAPYPFPLDTAQPAWSDADFKKGEALFQAMACLQCHTLSPVGPADEQPPAAGVQAPNLARAHVRLQRRWARHWVQETGIVQVGTPMPPFFSGLGAFKLDGLSWPRAVPPKGEKADELTRWVEETYGPTADDQARALLGFVYEAGRRGYRVDRPATPAPAAAARPVGIDSVAEGR